MAEYDRDFLTKKHRKILGFGVKMYQNGQKHRKKTWFGHEIGVSHGRRGIIFV